MMHLFVAISTELMQKICTYIKSITFLFVLNAGFGALFFLFPFLLLTLNVKTDSRSQQRQ